MMLELKIVNKSQSHDFMIDKDHKILLCAF